MQRICSIPGCGRNYDAKGLCVTHYARLYRYKTPLDKPIPLRLLWGKREPILYSTWSGMIGRCENPKNIAFKNYGGRGITMCSDWRNSPSVFIEWSKVNGHQAGLSIDRINNDKGYSPENCRWVDRKTQNRNTRKVRLGADKLPEILALRAKGLSQEKIGKLYDVKQAAISKLLLRKTWVD